MNFRKLPKEKRDLLAMVCLGTGTTLVLLNFFLIGGLQDKLADNTRLIADKRDKVYKAEQMVQLSDRIKTNLRVNEARLAKLEDTMPPADQYRWLVETVPPFMIDRNVHFEECAPKPVIESVPLLPKLSDYKTASFAVKASARYMDFGRFVADFENAFPYVIVQNLRIRPQGSRGGKLAVPLAKSIPNPDLDLPGSSSTDILEFDLQIVCLCRP